MYKHRKDLKAIIRIDGANIPLDPANVDYQRVLAWVAEGNTIAPAQTPEEAEIDRIEESNARIKEELEDADKRAIRALLEDDRARIAIIRAAQSARRQRLVPPGE